MGETELVEAYEVENSIFKFKLIRKLENKICKDLRW